MNQRNAPPRLWIAAAVWLVVAFAPVETRADALAGTWNLESYRLEGMDQPADGIMIFAEGHFAMVYAFEQSGHSGLAGRGHGGTYRTDGDEVTFVIPWWVQHVAGEPQVMTQEVEAKGRFEQEGDRLIIRFASGSEQHFTRAPSGDGAEISEAWLMTNYESRAKTGPASGMLLFSGPHFALLYTMRPTGGTLDGRAHAGRYEKVGSSMELEVDWSLQVIAGEGSVAEEPAKRSTTLTGDEQTVELDLGGGAVQTFRRAR